MPRITSFDVFDTVLTRLTGDPRQVFVLTGRRLREMGVLEVDPEVYAAAREAAHREVATQRGTHAPLASICAEVAARLGLAPSVAKELLQAELQLEREVCRAVPGAGERLQRGRRETQRGVIFVSDTPLPEPFLIDLLDQQGLWCDGDELYASADRGASKQQGGLFDLVAAELNAAPEAFVHVGDDRWADVAHPRLRGWHASHDLAGRLTAHERRLDSGSVGTQGVGSRLAGASRMGRMAAVQRGIDPNVAAIAGAVAFPLLAGFSLWALHQAQLLQLERLYFVARDGEVLLGLSGPLAKQAEISVTCRYLYGSRLSWHLASTAIPSGRDHEEWLHDEDPTAFVSLRRALSRVGLTPAEAFQVTGRSLFAAERADDNLGPGGWEELRTQLRSGPLAEELHRRAADQRELMLAYLDQEEVTAPGRVGIVDVGWQGRTARSLEEVLRGGDRPLPAAHLFLGLRKTAPARMGPDLYARSSGWLFDEARGRTPPPGAQDPVLSVESFTMGREGYTLGYHTEGQRVMPRLVMAENTAAVAWGLDEFREALGLTLSAFLDGPAPSGTVDLRPLVWNQLLAFWKTPSKGEAAAWGSQPWSEDYTGKLIFPLAAPITSRRVAIRLGVGRPEWRQPTYWWPGTVSLSPEPWRSLLRATAAGRRLGAQVRRIPARVKGEVALRRPSAR